MLVSVGSLRKVRLYLLSVIAAAHFVNAQPVISTVAGTDVLFTGDHRPALEAPLGGLDHVLMDRQGNVLIADEENNLVAKIGSDGILEVVAGNGLLGFSGDGGLATSASLAYPTGLALDTAGNLYISEQINGRIRKVDLDGNISTVISGLGRLFGIAFDSRDTLYIADATSHKIWKRTAGGDVSTFAGKGEAGFGGDGGPAVNALLNSPIGLAVDKSDNVYIADSLNLRVRRVTPDGRISTVAGGGLFAGEGIAATSSALSPVDVFVDSGGNLYATDFLVVHGVRKVTPAGIITTLAGTGEAGFSGDGGPARNARFTFPSGITADTAGNLFVADRAARRLRMIKASDGAISTIAGNGLYRYSRDGIKATAATLIAPDGVGVDGADNLYIADSGSYRIRKIGANGVITTVAGTGEPGNTGDGGPAVKAALSNPSGLFVDSAGNIYFADSVNARVRKIDTNGIITTVAGNGINGFDGDGGLAINAKLAIPSAVTVTKDGIVYIVDAQNLRIRKVARDGLISTLAGNGMLGSSGDGGPATNASLDDPLAVAVDKAGNVYISVANRVRRVRTDGIIETFAGTGQPGYSGDGGPATRAMLGTPLGLAFDAAGNLFVSVDNRIRMITPAGIITTVAGNGNPGFAGDGGLALNAMLSAPSGLAFDSAGNLYIGDQINNRVRVVLAKPPDIQVSPGRLPFSGRSTGAPTAAQSISISAAVPGLPFAIALATTDGASWLSADLTTGAVPASVRIVADPARLRPGNYTGTVTISSPILGTKSQTVAVTFSVGAAAPAKLGVDSPGLSFAFLENAPAGAQALPVSNKGDGSLSFKVDTKTNSGGNWLSASLPGGTATAAVSTSLEIAADPSGLAPGTYNGSISIFSPDSNETASVPVTMIISKIQQRIVLSQTGLTFTAVQKGGSVPPQSFGVVNIGQGVMKWSVTSAVFSDGPNWLSVSPDSGSTDASSLSIPLVNVAIDATGLAPGDYYGEIEVSAEGADNSPQFLTVVLNVLREGSNPGPLVRPTGLIFTALRGQIANSQEITISNLTATPLSFISGRLPADPKNWFVHVPSSGTVLPNQPARIVVQPVQTDLPAGFVRGTITLQFDDPAVPPQNIELLQVLVQGSPGKSNATHTADELCTPDKLFPVFTLAERLNVTARWPNPLEVRVVDNCGSPMVAGSVVISFSNTDPLVIMNSLKDGRWTGTWQPRNTAPGPVSLTARAEVRELNIEGVSQSSVAGIQANDNPPVLQPGAVVNSANFSRNAPLAPGTLISIFGTRLSASDKSASGLPLQTQLEGTRVSLAGKALPLVAISGNRIDAIVPYDVPANMRHQVLVRRDQSVAVPEAVTVSPAQPAIFTTGDAGAGRGKIFGISADGSEFLVDPGHAVTAGDQIVIPCTGLGAVDPPVAAGTAAPNSPLSRAVANVSVTIGGIDAPVSFAGLAPGTAGIYQINTRVPDGVSAGDAVQVIISVGGQASDPVTIAVK